jgi:hypothetical protein
MARKKKSTVAVDWGSDLWSRASLKYRGGWRKLRNLVGLLIAK